MLYEATVFSHVEIFFVGTTDKCRMNNFFQSLFILVICCPLLAKRLSSLLNLFM